MSGFDPIALSFKQTLNSYFFYNVPTTLTFIYTFLLPEGQTGEVWEPPKKQALSKNGEHWIEKKILSFFRL